MDHIVVLLISEFIIHILGSWAPQSVFAVSVRQYRVVCTKINDLTSYKTLLLLIRTTVRQGTTMTGPQFVDDCHGWGLLLS